MSMLVHVIYSMCRKAGQVVGFSSLSELRSHTTVEHSQELMNFLDVQRWKCLSQTSVTDGLAISSTRSEAPANQRDLIADLSLDTAQLILMVYCVIKQEVWKSETAGLNQIMNTD